MQRPEPAHGDGEMDGELAVHSVGAAPGMKGVLVRRGAFGVKREFFAVAQMSVPERRLLRKRLSSELDAVRDALRMAELVSCRAGDKGGLLLAAAEAPPVEEGGGGGRSATRRKVCPSAEQSTRVEAKRMMPPGVRERLAGRLASLAAVLPDHVVAFLQNQRVGDGDSSRGDCGGKIEKAVMQSMKGGALLQLKIWLDNFAPERSAPPKSHGGRGPPSLVGFLSPVQEEKEEAEGVDICGGVSRIAIRDIAEEYGDLVEGVGVKLLSPLQRKYVDLAEQGEFVDICGDASPVVFPNKTGDDSSSPSLSSSDDSDTSSSDSDSSISSFSDSGSDPDKCVSTRSPLELVPNPKEKGTCAQPPEPTPVATVHAAAPEGVQDQRAPCVPALLPITTRSPPAPVVLPPKVNDTYAQLPEPAPGPEMVQIAQKEDRQEVQCAVAAPTVHLATGIPPSAVLPKENDTYTQPEPPLPAPEPVQIAEPEELQRPSMAAPATATAVHPITGSAPPSENGISSQPVELAPVAAQIADQPEQLQGVVAAAEGITDLVTLAKEEAERRRQLAKERAKAEARRALAEVERAALPDQRVHPRDMQLLGIAAFEHVTSTVLGARTAPPPPPQVNEGLLHVFPGGPSILQQLGVFLKADDDEEEAEQQLQQQPPLACHGGEDMEVEDGEIR